ncbi:MAG TPA: peptidoglycan DD-metalloendopeptidase family protein [Thiohalobacter sp.]|nr:peptidoglycan DD-metalloendopeptidase family protein [Thiohalobacter sp.]
MRRALSQCVRLLLLAVLLGGCGGRALAPVGVRGEPDADRPPYHSVERGESLYSIAWKYGLDYQQLARWNGIASPYTIYVNQKLRLRPAAPAARADSRPAPAPASRPTPAPERDIRIRSSPAPRTPATASAPYSYPDRVSAWRWPAQGRILRPFDPNSPGKKGITISGERGEKIRAAAAGRIVYSGSGLVGYGRLIIVKHSEDYLSAYGHNDKLLVSEGDVVKAGQVLALMGSTGTNRIQLHFEIRRKGKPVDPLQYLPRRN